MRNVKNLWPMQCLVKHRTMPLFRQGCHYYNQVVRMTKSELKAFFDCFFKLLKDHEKLEEILWVI